MVIKNGRVINPSDGLDKICDILIEDGLIKEIGDNLHDDMVIDASGLVVAPGLVDVHVHFRDPGFTQKEDIYSGAKAAACGGFTSVVCMANTNPILDNEDTLNYFLNRARECDINVYTVAALTKGFKGEELVDMEKLISLGVVGFSDDGIPNTNTSVIVEGMKKAKNLNVPISFHEEDPSLNRENGINHGKISDALGLYGAPAISEEVYVNRDCLLSYRTGAKIDIQHLSSGGSVEIIRHFKKLGANVHCEVTPHHFTSTEDLVLEKGTMAKMNPPLRTSEDRDRLIEGLVDGTIDIIATDHAPHTLLEKNVDEYTKAPSGIIGLENSLSMGITHLVNKNHLSLMQLLEKMTINPARAYNLDAGEIKVGKKADIVIFDEDSSYILDDNFQSKAKNCPYIGEKLYGKVLYTIYNGKVVYKK